MTDRNGPLLAATSFRIATGFAVAVLAAASVTGCTFAGGVSPEETPRQQLPEAALDVMEQPQYADGRWQVYVEDLDTGEVLIDLDGDKMAEPGSFVKTYSVGAAWMQWGPDSTVTTPVKRTGEIANGTLEGDLVLVGKGDITMGGRTRADGTVDYANLDHNDANPLPGATLTPEDPLTGLNDLAAQVKSAGVDTVAGDVIVDDRLFQDELAGQPISPIVINQNIIDVLITPGAEGEPATGELIPAVAPFTLTVDVDTVAAGGDTQISNPSSPGGGEIVVSGTIAADSSPQLKVYAFDDPATFARTAFIEALGRAGVTVSTDPVTANSTSSLPSQDEVDELPSVAELESLPLAEEATYVMKVSYNRGAQTFICRLAVEAGSDTDEDGGCWKGLALAGQLWKDAGLDITGAALIDGSGLDGNLVTAENAVAAQRILAERDDAERWRETLPILGVDGSLADVQADSEAAGKVFAKTGSLVGGDSFNDRTRLATKTLGGVMETEKGRTLLFAITVNNGFYPGIEGVFAANDDVGAVAAAIQQAY